MEDDCERSPATDAFGSGPGVYLSLTLDLSTGATVVCTSRLLVFEAQAHWSDAMICKVCGTEIADKALICFRCGTSTFESARRQRPGRRRSTSLVPSVIALLVLVVAALLMARAVVGAVPRTVGVVLLVLAAVAILLQTLLRRRRR